MSATLTARSAFVGGKLQQQARGGRTRCATPCVAAVKKVNSYDEEWSKGALREASGASGGCRPARRCGPSLAGIGSIGIFLEDREKPAVNIFKQVEKKKLLSTVEKAGLLT